MKIVIIGSGFTGLAAALKLKGQEVTIIEADDRVGGLASGFTTAGQELERFYHHWFTSDTCIMRVVKELNLESNLQYLESATGLYYNTSFFRLSSPLDLLKFKAVSFTSRIRLAFFVLYARRIKNWKKLENITASDWLRKIGGDEVYRVVWEPLLKGKFGPYAETISAVWFWKKLCLRGGSRAKNGKEQLVYFEGGFMQLSKKMAEETVKNGSTIRLNCQAKSIVTENNTIKGVLTSEGFIGCDKVLATVPIPIYRELLKSNASSQYLDSLDNIKYIGNVCLVMELDRSLSKYYWLNVNDPSFPFVGIIEHTNLVNKHLYGDRHIVYLSKYLPTSDPLYSLDSKDFLSFAAPYIRRMFPDFEISWVINASIWKSAHSQPIVSRNYSAKIPEVRSPVQGLYLSTMAQIYPEDRGTNYAIEYGERAASIMIQDD